MRQGLIQFFGKQHVKSKYYQGFNDVIGFLQSQFGYAQAMIFTEGLSKNYLFDFTNLPFSDCLIPVFKTISEVVAWKQPAWEESEMLFMAIQSKHQSKAKSNSLVCCCSWILTWFTHFAKGDNILKIWDFLIASKPSMIIFLCSSILLREWNEEGFSADNMMECITKLKELKFGDNLTQYFEDTLKLEAEFCKSEDRVQAFNDLLLEK